MMKTQNTQRKILQRSGVEDGQLAREKTTANTPILPKYVLNFLLVGSKIIAYTFTLQSTANMILIALDQIVHIDILQWSA